MRAQVWWVMAGLALTGCATTYPVVEAPPLAEDLAWSAPTPVGPPSVPAAEGVPLTDPREARSGAEKVYEFTAAGTYRVDVPVGAPMNLLLQPGEEIRDLADGDRSPAEDGQAKPLWEFKQSYAGSGSSGRPVVLVTVPKTGLKNGLTITTTKRLYTLDLRSVGQVRVRSVRWTYPDEAAPVVKIPPRLWPDPAQPQRYHAGYAIETTEPKPVWSVRQVVDDGHKTYLIFPSTVTSVDAPLIRLVGSQGPEMVNARQAGNVVILDRLFNRAELRLGASKRAEVVTIQRQVPRTIACPGDPECPVWPDALAKVQP